MCMDFDELATVLHSRWQKARIAHKCGECCRQIRPGEHYTAERLIVDGSAQSLKTCAHCMTVRDYLIEECGQWVYTAMEEDIQGHFYGDLANDADTRRLRLLAVGMEACWQRADGSLWPVPKTPTKPNLKGIQ